jgi:NAD dependent epimerase/dehydratase
METVLVTGADGFIGSHLTESLAKKGLKVRALCQYNSFNSRGWIDTFDNAALANLDVILGDIRDPNLIRESMQGVSVVYHLAALIAIPYSYHAPNSYVDTNVTGTLNVLNAAQICKPDRLLVTSTSEVYGTAMRVPIDEAHPRQAQSPYSATKIAADALAESYYRTFGTPLTIVRPFNTYGPRQSARAVIPTIISQLLSGIEEINLGDLRPTRDLVYVADTVEGFQRIAATASMIGEEVNIATECEISIGQLANELINIINPSALIKQDDVRLRPQKSEVFRLLGSAKKLLEHTGWKPTIGLHEGLVKTIEWFQDSVNLSSYKANMYTI